PSWLPRVVESPELTGVVSPLAARLTGLNEGTPVVGGAGDQAAQAVGTGIVRTGLVSATIGTSGVVFAHLDQPAVDLQGRLHSFCHAVPSRWHVMGVMLSAGGALRWLRVGRRRAQPAVATHPGRCLSRGRGNSNHDGRCSIWRGATGGGGEGDFSIGGGGLRDHCGGRRSRGARPRACGRV